MAESAASNVTPLVAIAMGSDSDLPVMSAAADICDRFQVPYILKILSAHRTPERMVEFSRSAHEQGIQVIIAGAGGAAHLPGMMASLTPLPVIGVPVPTRHLQGLDSLYSIVQMPRGIPVATVAIGNAQNAGLLAVQILGSSRPNLLKQVQEYRTELARMVVEKDTKLEQIGHALYLNSMH
ncbi:MAG: 5-(carboxyamino)imidazole ribonucleotide mutase [Cyanobacteria bacterium P01_D01_bin.123]